MTKTALALRRVLVRKGPVSNEEVLEEGKAMWWEVEVKRARYAPPFLYLPPGPPGGPLKNKRSFSLTGAIPTG